MEDYPIKIPKQATNEETTNTRAMTQGRLILSGISTIYTKTCVHDVIQFWNLAPSKIRNSTTLYKAKKLIKTFVKTLPI